MSASFQSTGLWSPTLPCPTWRQSIIGLFRSFQYTSFRAPAYSLTPDGSVTPGPGAWNLARQDTSPAGNPSRKAIPWGENRAASAKAKDASLLQPTLLERAYAAEDVLLGRSSCSGFLSYPTATAALAVSRDLPCSVSWKGIYAPKSSHPC